MASCPWGPWGLGPPQIFSRDKNIFVQKAFSTGFVAGYLPPPLAYGGGRDAPPEFRQGDEYANPISGLNISLYGIFSRFLQNFLARYAQSIAFYKISVPEIIYGHAT